MLLVLIINTEIMIKWSASSYEFLVDILSKIYNLLENPCRHFEVCVMHVREAYTGTTSFEDTVASSKNTIELIN